MKPTRIGDRLEPYRVTRVPRWRLVIATGFPLEMYTGERLGNPKLQQLFPMHEGVRGAK